jgi:mono/diheme cytochrome c family protein
MPTFKGIVDEEGIQKLVAYIKSIGNEPGANTP